jgi:hypothetical protein
VALETRGEAERRYSSCRRSKAGRKTGNFRRPYWILQPDSQEEPMPANRELIDTGTDKRYVRRDEKGQFKDSDDVGKSLAADRRQTAKTKAKKGQGDRGDH